MADFESSTNNDKIIGTDSDDYITSQGLRASINGGAGDDHILAGGYISTVEGGDGNDVVEVMQSYIIASGGDGNDNLMVYAGGRFSNIGNVSLTGGAGADAFIFAPTYIKSADSDGNDVYNWKNILSSDVMDFSVADDDYIVLRNVGEGDFDEATDDVKPETYNLYINRNAKRELVFSDYNGRVTFTLDGITRFSDVADARIYYQDQSGISTYGQYLKQAVSLASLDSGVQVSNDWVILSGTGGNGIWLEDTSFNNIDAVEDSVAGRALVGNENDNVIFAGDYGSKLWGKGGNDTLYGGAGADTFYADRDQATVSVINFGDDDILKLSDVYFDDLESVMPKKFDGVNEDRLGAYEQMIITTKSGSLIKAVRPDDANTLTVQLADATTFRFNYDDQSWSFADRESIAPLEESQIIEGPTMVGSSGADTFRAYSGDGDVQIFNYDSEDLIDLSGVAFSDVKNIYTFEETEGNIVCVETNDLTVNVVLEANENETITYALADGSSLRHDSSQNTWQRRTGSTWKTISEVNGAPINVRLNDGIAYIFPNYEGDFSLDDLNDSSINTVSAYYDTLNGRKIFGDERSNRLRASNTAGTWLWGGDGGDDTLVGGAGADTFQAGQGEGTTFITDYESADLVYLHNVNVDDIGALGVSSVDGGITAYFATEDGSEILLNTATDKTIDFRLADGSGLRYDVDDDEWKRRTSSSGSWRTITELNGSTVGTLNGDLSALLDVDLNALSSKDNHAVETDDVSSLDATNKKDLKAVMLQFVESKRHSLK